MSKRIYELHPVFDGAKSFYGKATIRTEGDDIILRSYNTDVAKISCGKFIRLWSGYSATTMRHVAEFHKQAGLGGIGKADWKKLRVCA